MTRPVPQAAVDFISKHEGCCLKAYRDAGAGIWTVGFGHTQDVTADTACTRSQANMWLLGDLTIAAQRLAGVVDAGVIARLSDHQYAALLSFVFNVGANPSWTIWRRLKAGEISTIPAELMRFIYAGKKVVPGLVNRRAAEVDLWQTPDAAPAPLPPVMVAAAAPPPPVPASANAGFLSKIWNNYAGLFER